MTRRSLVLVVLVVTLGMIAVACGGNGGDTPGNPDASGPSGEVPTGGTLRLALQSDMQEAFDPQKEYYGVAWAFYRCCLLRTLLSYNGMTTDEGGPRYSPTSRPTCPRTRPTA